MSFPKKAIDRLFERMAAAYGAQWSRMWEGVPIQDVKTAWCHELDAFDGEAGLQRVAWALDNLPDKVMNAPGFRNLCRLAPSGPAPALPLPPENQERMRAELAKLGHVEKAKRMPTTGGIDPKAWAKRHIARHEAGEKVRPISLKFARDAMRCGCT
jgi:hypothetical protein